MALSWTYDLYEDRLYSVYAPIVVGASSSLHAEDAYRYRLKIYTYDNDLLCELNQPPAGDSGECYFQIEAILRDYLVTRKFGDSLRGQFQTTAQSKSGRAKKFKVSMSGRYIDSSGNEQIETLTYQPVIHALVSKPALSEGFRTQENSSGYYEVNWNYWAPSLDRFYRYGAFRWRSVSQNYQDANMNERPIFDVSSLDQGFGYEGATQKQRRDVVQRIISPPCYRVTSMPWGANPGSVPPGGANLEGGNLTNWQVLFYQEVGEQAFASYSASTSFDPIYATDDCILDCAIGYKNLEGNANIPAQTLASSNAWSVSFHTGSPTTSNQVGPTIWCINECEDDPHWGEPVNITFLNRRGGWETIIFYKSRSTSTRMTKRNTYTPHEGSFVLDSTGARFTFNPQVKVALPSQYQRSISLTSQYVPEEESILFEALMVSPLIYLHAEDNDVFMELICTTTNLIRQDLRGDGLIRYSLSFDFATINQA